jgi:hypothetical protein
MLTLTELLNSDQHSRAMARSQRSSFRCIVTLEEECDVHLFGIAFAPFLFDRPFFPKKMITSSFLKFTIAIFYNSDIS